MGKHHSKPSRLFTRVRRSSRNIHLLCTESCQNFIIAKLRVFGGCAEVYPKKEGGIGLVILDTVVIEKLCRKDIAPR